MLNKKLKLITVFVLGLGLTGLHAQTMYVKEKNGTQTSFIINDIRKLTFSPDGMTVSQTAGNSKTYHLTTIRYLNFIDLSTDVFLTKKQDSEKLVLYPNPANDVLTLFYPTFEGKSLQVEIMTLDAKVVYRQVIETRSLTNGTNINIASLPNGLYLCRLFNEKTFVTNKFLKQ